MTISSVGELYEHGRTALAAIADGGLEVALLVEALLKIPRARILAFPETTVAADAAAAFRSAIARRCTGEPLAYILGTREFYGHAFEVTPATLIPRPESEMLIDQLRTHAPYARTICEIGTGSGCLAITAALELTAAHVQATDISAAALLVADRNARALGVAERVRFVAGDLFAGIDGRFDVVIANLPYIPTADLAEVNSRAYEPQAALDGGVDGLAIYRRLLDVIAPYLEPASLVLFEAAPPTIPGLLQLTEAALPDARVEQVLDYSGRARIVRCIAPRPAFAAAQGESRNP